MITILDGLTGFQKDQAMEEATMTLPLCRPSPHIHGDAGDGAHKIYRLFLFGTIKENSYSHIRRSLPIPRRLLLSIA
jgi:hypothetical protein